ncbi:hypothetical protein [Streptomyces sp. BK79]|uniref:hypothetical protein n=1 Tax=Streptomyces sp. BK79 TaxID=3350097 RepID=UPI00376F7B0B
MDSLIANPPPCTVPDRPGETGEEVHHALLCRHRFVDLAQVVAVCGVQPGALVPVRSCHDPGRDQPDANGGLSYHEIRGGGVVRSSRPFQQSDFHHRTDLRPT